jgi:hypothetical protein
MGGGAVSDVTIDNFVSLGNNMDGWVIGNPGKVTLGTNDKFLSLKFYYLDPNKKERAARVKNLTIPAAGQTKDFEFGYEVKGSESGDWEAFVEFRYESGGQTMTITKSLKKTLN